MIRHIGALLFSFCLLAPITVQAYEDHPRHEWNEQENPYWHQYLKEHHKKDREWNKANKRDQEAYWKWRDQHRDAH